MKRGFLKNVVLFVLKVLCALFIFDLISCVVDSAVREEEGRVTLYEMATYPLSHCKMSLFCLIFFFFNVGR